MTHLHLGVAWLALVLTAGAVAADEPKKKDADPAKALIDLLPEVSEQDTGYSGSSSGTAFLPLGRSESHVVLLFQRPHAASDAMRSLVKLGTKAVPSLLEHLSDDRPTKIEIPRDGLGGLFLTPDRGEKVEGFLGQSLNGKGYTVRVGDLCYVALGQIVNRDYEAVCYQPTAIVIVTSLSRNKELRAELKKEWGQLTPDKHRDALAKDLESGNENTRDGASFRLAYYYPEAFEAIALKQLGHPTGAQAGFVQTLLYDRSERLDRVLRDLLAKTDDVDLAEGCLNRLVGRGYDADIESYLKRRLPKVKEEDRDDLRKYEAKLGWTRLHAAVDLNVPDLIEAALKDGINVKARGRDGRTALHLAAAGNKVEAVELLLKAKADPNAKDGRGRTAVEAAARADRREMVRLLLAAKGEVSGVFTAAIVGDAARLGELLKGKPELARERNEAGLTPLHVAAREGHEAAALTLLHAGADANAVDEPTGKFGDPDRWTPLHVAAREGKSRVAKVLLDKGADPNRADHYFKRTPLHYAATAGDAETVKVLLAGKANRAVKDEDGHTPLDVAKEWKHELVVKLLEGAK